MNIQIFSSAGYNVALYDTVPAQLKDAVTNIEAQLVEMEGKGLLRCSSMTAKKATQLVTCSESLTEALEGAFYVQVNFVEHRISNSVVAVASSSSSVVVVVVAVVVVAAAAAAV